MTHRPSEGDAPGRGRGLSSPGRFVNDDGAPDESIRQARSAADVIAALQAGRVIVAVTAVATAVDETGADKESDMAVVSMVAPDGRRGLLAFSGLDSLSAWDSTARPVPVSGPDAARAAIDDGCEALVIDVAGPRQLVVVEADLLAVAGLDPVEHARGLAQQQLDDAVGAGRVVIQVGEGGALHAICDAELAQKAAALLQSAQRIHALVPGGIEIRLGG